LSYLLPIQILERKARTIWSPMRLHFNGRLLALHASIRLARKRITMANKKAYDNAVLVTTDTMTILIATLLYN
jgi:hypothetical protein